VWTAYRSRLGCSFSLSISSVMEPLFFFFHLFG
jgi:hypothetical protein